MRRREFIAGFGGAAVLPLAGNTGRDRGTVKTTGLTQKRTCERSA